MTRKILCPVDFSKGSERALEKAEELALALGAELELFHAYQLPMLALPETPAMENPAFVNELTDRANQALGRMAAQLQTRAVTSSTRLQEGPAESISARAREIGADMIVMGTHGRSGFRRFLLGSTAERVLRTSTVPVLTVHLPE